MRRVNSTIPARMESRDPEIFRSHHIQFSDLQRRRPSEKFSVLETESGDFRLSPAYDLINTKLHVDDRIFALDKGLLKDNAAESMPYGMTNSTTFREFGKRLGLPDKTIRRELDKFCTSYPLLDTLIANSYLSDELKENYRNMYLGRRDSYLKIGL